MAPGGTLKYSLTSPKMARRKRRNGSPTDFANFSPSYIQYTPEWRNGSRRNFENFSLLYVFVYIDI